MAQLVAEVREPGALRLHLGGDRDGFGDAHVRGVGILAEGIHDQMPYPADAFNHRVGHRLAVAEIRREPLPVTGEEITEDRRAPVGHG
jgi:hypothetical protein